MAFEAGRGGSGLEPKLAGLRLTPADFAGRRRRTPQDLGRILAGPGAGPSGPPVLGGPILPMSLPMMGSPNQIRQTGRMP